MKKNRLIKLSIIGLLFVGLMNSCTEDDDDNLTLFDGVQMFDDNGNPVGCYGPCGDDWEEIELSTDELLHLILIPDMIVVGPQQGTYSFQSVKAYPIPIRHDGDMFLSVGCNQEVKFKMAVVSNNDTKLAFLATKVDQNNQAILLDDVFFANVPLGEIVRMYYGYFDDNDTALYTGYGDFTVCRKEYDGADISLCFE